MRAFEIMTEGVETVSADLTADEAWETMRRKGIHHLVAMRGQELAGVLSDRDVGGRSGEAVRVGQTVADLMTPHVITAAPADTIRSLASAGQRCERSIIPFRIDHAEAVALQNELLAQ